MQFLKAEINIPHEFLMNMRM